MGTGRSPARNREKSARSRWLIHCFIDPLFASLPRVEAEGHRYPRRFLRFIVMAMPRVLVVDDHPDTLRLFQTFLSLAGFDVVAFTRASDALSAAADVDAVATDLAMPGMDGFELIRRLRASPHVPAIPIVAVTGQSLDLEKVVPADIGCCRVVLKPCDLGQLADALRSLIDTCPRACAHCANR